MLRNRTCSFRDGLLVVGIAVVILLCPPLLRSGSGEFGRLAALRKAYRYACKSFICHSIAHPLY